MCKIIDSFCKRCLHLTSWAEILYIMGASACGLSLLAVRQILVFAFLGRATSSSLLTAIYVAGCLLEFAVMSGICFPCQFTKYVRHCVDNEDSLAEAQRMRVFIELPRTGCTTTAEPELSQSLGSSEEAVQCTGTSIACFASQPRPSESVGSSE